MAHQQLNPVNVSPRSGALSEVEEHNRFRHSKRPREDESAGDAPELKRLVKAVQDVVYRIIVPPSQIGKVIGTAGHRIRKIREVFKASIEIADAISWREESVIIISSKNCEGELCDAELALHHIVGLILKDDDDADIETQEQAAGHVTANTIRLLLSDSQAARLIGFNGQNIEILRIESRSTITVLAQSELPPCTSALESDFVVKISGDVGSIHFAVRKIGFQLRTITLVADYVDLDLRVPEAMAGGLIGRSGSNISRIRKESGATITIYGSKGEGTQRKIHLGGTGQQVSLARQRIDEFLYSRMVLESAELPSVCDSQPAVSNTMFQANTYPQENLFQGYGHSGGLYTISTCEPNVIPIHSGRAQRSTREPNAIPVHSDTAQRRCYSGSAR